MNTYFTIFAAFTLFLQNAYSQRTPQAIEAEALEFAPYGGDKEAISLRNLDLKKVPSEKELRMAGQLGSALTPNGPAEPSLIESANERIKLEKDNVLFGEAMNLWNRHDYKEAVKLFKKHRRDFAGSPWMGESELHMGCEAQFNGRWNEAREHFDYILANTEVGSDIYQKAKLRLSVLFLEQGMVEESSKSFSEMLETEKTWERRTYAQNWMRHLSLLEANLEKIRICGSESVAHILELRGAKDVAETFRIRPAHGKYGYTLAELRSVAAEAGLNPTAIRAQAADIGDIPMPFIAHYEDEHYVVVVGRQDQRNLKIFDPRLKHDIVMTNEEFASQWSGLGLLLDGAKPKSISDASSEDLNRIGGCCGIPRPEDDIGPCGEDSKKCKGMPVWEINPVNMNMMVQDIPLWYDNTVGPDVEILLTYNSLDALNQLRPFGNKWTFNYSSYALEGPGGVVTIIMPHGRRDVYSPSGVINEYISPMRRAGYTLVKTGTYAYTLTLPDGTSYLYGVPAAMSGSSTSSLLLSVRNKSNESVTLTHNSTGRLTKIIDALNRETLLTYDGTGKISQITDPFGRACTFGYDGNGNLVSQTDMGGLSYSYTYMTAAQVETSTSGVFDYNVLFIDSITTPNGTTTFFTEPPDGINNGLNDYPMPGTAMWSNFRITVTHPEGNKEEYHYNGNPKYAWHRDGRQYEALQADLVLAGSDAAAYKTAGLNAPKTRFNYSIQWGNKGIITLITFADGTTRSFGNFNGNGQPRTVINPRIGYTYYTYNAQGSMLTARNPRTYTTTFEYQPNGLDVKKVINPASVTVAEYGYDSNRRVISVKDAANNETQFTYTSRGAIASETNALNETTTYNRNGLHQVTSITRAGQTIQQYTYDTVGRVATSTDATGTTLAYEYDGLNRVTKVIHSDGSFQKYTYVCCGMESSSDRQGRTTHYTYDANKRLVVTRDPAGRITQYFYDAASNLVRLVDGNGNSTRFEYDARNRVNKKIYADGTFESYIHDGNGNRTQKTNARNQQVNYAYDANDNLTSISGTGLTTTSFLYDTLDRRTRMTDASGQTNYGYNTLDQVTSVDGPLASDTIGYSYDAPGRIAAQTWGTGQSRAFTYDTLGRLQQEVNGLGTFGYSYAGASDLVTQVTRPLSRTEHYVYAASPAERRLTQAQVKNGSTVKSQFDYEYEMDGAISKITALLPLDPAREHTYEYDPAEQLTGSTEKLVSTGTVQQRHAYHYDSAGNRVSEGAGTTLQKASYNALNQLTSLGAGGLVKFSGQVNEPASVTVKGHPAQMLPTNRFEKSVEVAAGTNTVAVAARDAAGNTKTNTYQVTVPSGGSRTMSYDLDGNLLNDGVRDYEWDPLSRLRKITHADNTTTEFTYDGLNRWVRIVEKNAGGTTTNTRNFVWTGIDLLERRDGTVSANSRIFYPQGQLHSNGSGWSPVFYIRDHLGSVRAAYDSSTDVYLQNFDPFGKPATPSGMDMIGIGFTGHYYHEKSGLHLAPFRAYDASLARWISRDPIAEAGGINLYQYVWNNPTNDLDIMGLESQRCAALRRKAENIRKEIAERREEYRKDYLKLPKTALGDDLKPSLSRQGHIRLINEHKKNLAAVMALISVHCKDDEPPPPCETATSTAMSSEQAEQLARNSAIAVAAATAIGLGAWALGLAY